MARLLTGLALCVAWTAAIGDLSTLNAEADRIHSNGKTALMVAAKNGDRERVQALLQEGADVNRANNNGGTPIMYAALSGDIETVSLLLEHNADANVPARNGWTAFMIACAKGYVDIAGELLRHGAEPNQQDVYSWTPLMRAAFEKRAEIVKLLLESESIRVNQRGENGVTALHLAVIQGDPDIVGQLLKARADPGIKDGSGRTALDFARQNNNLQLEQLIRTGLVE